jgi:periplasmic copper chaperone A
MRLADIPLPKTRKTIANANVWLQAMRQPHRPIVRRIRRGAHNHQVSAKTIHSPFSFLTKELPMKFFSITSKFAFAFLAIASTFVSGASAQISIDNAWTRSTVPGQKATGAFMTIASEKPLALVKASSTLIKNVEVHEMKMEAGVMKMREVKAIDVVPGKVTELKPGGYHIMLMGLEAPLVAGSKVPLTLTFRDKNNVETKVNIDADVRELSRSMPK